MGKALQKIDKNELALIKKDIVDVVANRVNEMVGSGQLQLPENYAAGNAIASWWLALQACVDKQGNDALAICTKDSVANATLDMVVQGLTPAKQQCYPIVYGKTLACQRSYFGDEAVLKRVFGQATRVYTEIEWAGDEVVFEIAGGRRSVKSHEQATKNITGKLKDVAGCYVVIEFPPELKRPAECEYMTIEQIKTSWKKSKTYKGPSSSSPHTDAPDQFCKRTVIRRACKRLINTSDDHYLIAAVRRQEMTMAEAEADELAIEATESGELIDLGEVQRGLDKKRAAAAAADAQVAADEQAEQDSREEPDATPVSVDAETLEVTTGPETEAETQADVEEETSQGGDASETSESTPSEESESPSASSSFSRFQDLIDKYELNATRARKVLAEALNLADVRTLKNADYEYALKNIELFLGLYKGNGKTTGGGDGAALPGM